MSCFGGNISPDLFQKCCNANQLCEFSGNLRDVVTEPIFVQKVYDAVLFNLQGLKTVTGQCFSPAIPKGHRLKRVIDIRCKRFFNPLNVEDPRNLTLDVDTTISGATFIQDAQCDPIRLWVRMVHLAKRCCMQIQKIAMRSAKVLLFSEPRILPSSGDVLVTLDLLLCDRCDHEVIFTVSEM